MRGMDRHSGAPNNTLETIHAAASAIASAENRALQARPQKGRWASCWSVYWCFGYQKHSKRIGHAVLSPETSGPGNNAPAENPPQAPTNVLPFVAPPSSPASFLPSEPPSAAQSPSGLLSISANMYSPSGPTSIFAIGPYAHETQLVSPPVFSTFNTEPSTAPFTPPPESVHLTTPSSPEVPFAQLLDPSLQSGVAGLRFPLCNNGFQSYQLYPGIPVGPLISPRSGISGSGTSSPFPDGEFTPGGPQFLEFRMGDPPKLLNLDKLSSRESHQGSDALTPDTVWPAPCSFVPDHQFSDIVSRPESGSVNRNNQGFDHRASFDLNANNVLRCTEVKPAPSLEFVAESQENGTTIEREISCELIHSCEDCDGETSDNIPRKAPIGGEEVHKPQKHHSITLGSVKEFNFDNGDRRDSLKPESDWWTNGSVVEEEGGATKNWSFFPMIQSGVS
uniref:Hydroxyproline-rich glycoprotein family protein n=1 Tax=Rhizophora mucronata TaxID=61149 RepID=A0A2P2JZ88_RHIMU